MWYGRKISWMMWMWRQKSVYQTSAYKHTPNTSSSLRITIMVSLNDGQFFPSIYLLTVAAVHFFICYKCLIFMPHSWFGKGNCITNVNSYYTFHYYHSVSKEKKKKVKTTNLVVKWYKRKCSACTSSWERAWS